MEPLPYAVTVPMHAAMAAMAGGPSAFLATGPGTGRGAGTLTRRAPEGSGAAFERKSRAAVKRNRKNALRLAHATPAMLFVSAQDEANHVLWLLAKRVPKDKWTEADKRMKERTHTARRGLKGGGRPLPGIAADVIAARYAIAH